MPIEFRCPSCTKLLRTPDESAGKKAKCPQCGNIVDVPVGSDAPEPGPADPLGSQPTASPPAGDPGFPPTPGPTGTPADNPLDQFSQQSPFADSGQGAGFDNPYASPAAASKEIHSIAPSGDLVHRKLSFDSVFSTTWDIYSNNIGPCALIGLVVLGFNIGAAIVNQIIAFAAQASQEIVALVIAQIVSQVIGLLVNTWVQLGLVFFGIKLARSGEATVNDFFAVGPFYLRGLGGTLLLQLMVMAILAICALPAFITFFAIGGPPAFENDPSAVLLAAIPGIIIAMILIIWIFYRLFLYFEFIIDRNAGVIDSFRLSDQFMKGNKLTAFLLLLVVGLVGGLFVCITCGIGAIFFYPYSGLLAGVFYLLATGQPVINPKTQAK